MSGPEFASIPNVARMLSQWRTTHLENALRAKILEMDGRLPTLEEARSFADSAVFPDGTVEYKWRGTTILRVNPPQFLGSDQSDK
jgi:hypothetical protein